MNQPNETQVPATMRVQEWSTEGLDLDAYLDAMAPHLVEYSHRRFSGATLYSLLTSKPKQPVPVTLRVFLQGLIRFRARVRALSPEQRDLLERRVRELHPQEILAPAGFLPHVVPPPAHLEGEGVAHV